MRITTIQVPSYRFVATSYSLAHGESDVTDRELIRKITRGFRRTGEKVRAGKVRGDRESAYARNRPIFNGKKRTRLIMLVMVFAFGNWIEDRLYGTLEITTTKERRRRRRGFKASTR